jgi:hypothetical protein
MHSLVILEFCSPFALLTGFEKYPTTLLFKENSYFAFNKDCNKM